MTTWAILPSKTCDDVLIPHFWWQFFAHPSPEILTKHNTDETSSKCNIWVPLYKPKGAGSGGGLRIRKFYVIKKHLYKP